MPHPAYVDIFCARHEHWHQSDICPRCEIEDEPEICPEHDLELIDGDECEQCEAERKADMLHDMIKDGEA